MLWVMDEQMDGQEMNAVTFARVVDAVVDAARRAGSEVPAFRSHPATGGPRRWVRWGPDGAVVGIVRRGRPAVEVAGDVVEGVLLLNPGIPAQARGRCAPGSMPRPARSSGHPWPALPRLIRSCPGGEMADAEGLNPSGPRGSCGFDPRPGHGLTCSTLVRSLCPDDRLRTVCSRLVANRGGPRVHRRLGGLVNADRRSREFARLIERSGSPGIRLHDLRHSYATAALKAGVHPKVITERRGQATVGITFDLYSHLLKGLDADAEDLVASRIRSKRDAS